LFAAAGGGGHLFDGEMCVVEDHVVDERSLGRFQIWSHVVDLVLVRFELDEPGALIDGVWIVDVFVSIPASDGYFCQLRV
jgi:hypothetical protein